MFNNIFWRTENLEAWWKNASLLENIYAKKKFNTIFAWLHELPYLFTSLKFYYFKGEIQGLKRQTKIGNL